jgi:transposase
LRAVVPRPAAVTRMTTISNFSKDHALVKIKTYSIDFRQKIMDVYHNEPLSQRAIANRFCVALSFVQKLVKQYRDTQNIAPRTERCGVKLKLNAEQLLILAELIEANNDATLEELRYLLYQKIGFTISVATMGRMAKLLNMTVKKKLFSRQTKAVTGFRTCDTSSGKKLEKFVSKT